MLSESLPLKAILNPKGERDVIQAVYIAGWKHVARIESDNEVPVQVEVDTTAETRCKVLSLCP